MVEAKLSPEIPEILRFKVPPWFDPVPWFIWERLDKEKVLALTRVQLQLQKSILLAQQRALNEAIKVIG
jgi:hypothetical protein